MGTVSEANGGVIPTWSDWRPFPDPRKGEDLTSPIGPGCYELRHRRTDELILFGMSSNVAARLSSLLPKPWGCGTRSNSAKRDYVMAALADVDYRTIATTTRLEASLIENSFDRRRYRFPS